MDHPPRAAGRVAERVSLIGFGEAGGILGAALVDGGTQVATYDIKFDGPESGAMHRKAAEAGVRATASVAECVAFAQIIISAVTASSDTAVAEAVAAHIVAGQTFVDINSVSPLTKQHGQQLIERAGADFIEAAVMAPVPPYGLAVPMLLGGARADEVAEAMRTLGFNAKAVSTSVGVASAIKMCRSVMIKGLEALTVECLSAARRYGAEDAVMASLRETFSKLGRDGDPASYLISRVAEHGVRRAEEMREVAATLREVGVDPWMSEATAELQHRFVGAMTTHGLRYDPSVAFDWKTLVDDLNSP